MKGNGGGACAVHDRVEPQGAPVPPADDVLRELQAVLDSPHFDASPRSRSFLRFIVEETLAGRQAGLTQLAIATRVFGRRGDFDPTIDPVVRIQAGRLRRSLERLYLMAGPRAGIRLELPRGTYVPAFHRTEARVARPEASASEVDADGWPCVVLDLHDEPAGRFVDHLALELGRYGDVRVARRGELGELRGAGPGGQLFVLAGVAARAEGALRVTVRLVEHGSGRQVWAEEYEGRSSSDEFQAETARRVAARVASEQGLVVQTLLSHGRPAPHDGSTFAALLRSFRFFLARDPAELEATLDALRRAAERDPSCALVWLQLARLHVANHAFEIGPADTSLEQGLACAAAAVRLDPASQRARAALAFGLLVKGELGAGRAEAEAALALHPDSLVYLETLGWLLALLGDWERGLHTVRTAAARNPDHLPIAWHALWADHLRRGQVEAAYQAALQYRDSGFFWRALMQASCLGLLGRRAEAAVPVAELLRLRPAFRSRGRELIGRLIKFPDLEQQVVLGLARAGLELE